MDSILDFVVSGAGVSGVVVSKYLKENGITFLTLEKRDGIGGLWNYTDDENITTVTKKTITTSGQRITVFSDFPPHEEWTEFLKADQLLQHIHEYAEHYEIMDNIELGATILRVEKDKDGLWEVEYKDKHGDQKTVRARNFVVGGGAFSHKMTPLADKYASSFEGEFYAGQQIKLNDKIKFRGKRVLVTGGGETASDIAMHAACVADKAYWAIPGGLQSLDRCRVGGDKENLVEIVFDEGPSLKRNWSHRQHESDRKFSNEYFIHKFFGASGHGVKEWVTDNYYGNKFPVKNGETIYLVHEGKIKPYRSVENISGNRVFFDNGKSEEIDMIIECTGYQKGYGYFADESIQTPDYNKLYRGFIRTDDPTLYFVGLVRPTIGSVPAFVEYQSQYIVDLFKQSIELPSREEMQKRINEDMEYHKNLYKGGRYRPDIYDGYTYYPYVMSADMGRLPEDHLDGLSEEEKDKVLNASFNAGLFLWIGDPRKQADFIKSIKLHKTTKIFRSNLVRASMKGLKMNPLLRKLDEKVFKKKNAANLLLYGKGQLHRYYLIRKKFPLLMRAITKKNCGPFPLTHPYFTYKEIDFHSTTIFEKAAFFFLFAGIFLVLNFVANSGFNLSTYLCALVFLAAMYSMKLKSRKSLLLLGGLQAVAYYLLNGNQLTLEMLFAPIIYGTLLPRIVNARKTIPCMRQEVAEMQ